MYRYSEQETLLGNTSMPEKKGKNVDSDDVVMVMLMKNQNIYIGWIFALLLFRARSKRIEQLYWVKNLFSELPKLYGINSIDTQVHILLVFVALPTLLDRNSIGRP